MHSLTESERAVRATVKALHVAVRTELRAAHLAGGQRHRYAILRWAFLRGLPYRRFERSHRLTTNQDGPRFEHNLPSVTDLARALAPFLPEIAADIPSARWASLKADSPTGKRLGAWLTDPSGAIVAPAGNRDTKSVLVPVTSEPVGSW